MSETSMADIYRDWKTIKGDAPDAIFLMEHEGVVVAFGDEAYEVARSVNDKPARHKVRIRHAGDFTTAKVDADAIPDVVAALVAAGRIVIVARRARGEEAMLENVTRVVVSPDAEDMR